MQIFNFFQSNLPAIQKGITSTNVLTLTGPMPDEERKLTWSFISTLLCGDSKSFMKAFKAFIKPFKAQQRKVEIIF